ncbi:MAG: PRC-barrel domain-containing protein [Candidatus Magasanikbacteria bacterium]
MRFDLRQLRKMNVETESGMRLGKVFNIIFDTELQNILQYEVGNFFNKKQYLIGCDQVIRFEEKKMIVDDSMKKVGADSDRSRPIRTEPAMMREEI